MPRTPSTTNTRSRRRTPTTVVPTNPANRAVADAPPGPRTTFQKHHQPPEPGPPPHPIPPHPTGRRERGARSFGAAAAVGAWRRRHPRASGARTAKAPPTCPPRGGTSMRHWSRRGAARARGGLLTGRGRGRPGSAEEAAEHPERQRCPAAGSRGRHHRRPAGRATPRARGGDAALRGLLPGRWAVRGAGESRAPPAASSSPRTPAGSSSAGLGAAGEAQPSSSLRAAPASRSGSQWNAGGKKFKPRRKGRGSRGGDLPRPLPVGRVGGNHHPARRQERGAGAAGAEWGERGARRCRRGHCGRALPARPGGVTRRGSRPPGSSRGGLGRGEHAAPRAGGRAHARPQRGAARGGISPAPEQQRRQQRPETELETPPPPAAPAHPGGGRGGEALPPRPLQSPPRLLLLLLLLYLLLTVPLGLSEPSCPALASIGSRSEEAATGPGPSAGAGAERGGARLSPGGRRCWSWGFAGWSRSPAPTPAAPHPAAGNRTPSLGCLLSPSSPPLQMEMVQAPGAPAPREPQSGVRRAGLPSGPNTKGPSSTSRLEQRALQTPLMQMFSICN